MRTLVDVVLVLAGAGLVLVVLDSAVRGLTLRAQMADGDLNRCLDGESNSVAMIVRHMRGNMRSRWTDFLTTDGEKPWRQRESVRGECSH